ncbi:ryanodine receptor-like [Homalodisca vitripennis]|uniref:ryanodine receptor-like n=1 Tax=Homalodisca vitripennis TaxID=197043 RepID=UPI001EEB1535|nr:ryanodine receptor-like [Homalodisca vitripennis]
MGQREAVSDFLVALTSQMQPSMLLKLLRKLTVDVSKLSEYTTVALPVADAPLRQVRQVLRFYRWTRSLWCL